MIGREVVAEFRGGWFRAFLCLMTLAAGPQSPADECFGERERARAITQRVDEEWPLRPSGDEVSQYVQLLGERLARAVPGGAGAGLEWRFTTLRDHAPYAFAIGYGYVYVTDGTLAFVRGEAEFAAVLAHEIGHQISGHFCRIAGEGGRLSGGRAEVPLGSLKQILDLAKEQEADRAAVRILRAAGFDPWAMYSVAERLPQSDAYGTEVGDGRRLRSLRDALKGQRVMSGEQTDSAAFRRSRESIVGNR